MYLPPAVSSVTYNFKNTKVFNSTKENAKILYTNDINSIGPFGGAGNVKVQIFSLTGSVVRSFEYQNATEYNLFNNYETDPASPGVLYYYFTWDGKNDHGAIVKNGIYVIKIEITTTTGKKISKSRTIAVIK
jgi:flagellar hook assembly protein FlgD